MRCTKILLCVLMIFFVAASVGCGNAIKGAIKNAGKGASKIVGKVPNKIKRNSDVALDVADYALSDGGKPETTRPANNKPSTTGPISKTGALITGGAVVANEVLFDNGSAQILSGALTAKDLSLGDLSIDDRAEKISSVLGKPLSSLADNDGSKRSKFPDVEVVVRNGKISALVSLTPTFATPRGIREGSPAQDVFDRYGTNFQKSTYGDQTLYEYLITSADGHPCYLRFAVNNSDNKVGYISERFANSESDNTGEARQAFINYHKAITNGNYRAAYDMLSNAQQERIGDFNSYAAGYATTISSEVTDMHLVSSNGNSCTFDYTLMARDRYRGNGVKVQIFSGQVTMTKYGEYGGRWYVNYVVSNKVSERYE